MGLQDLALPLEALSKVLLAAEFNSQPGGIDLSARWAFSSLRAASQWPSRRGQSAHLRLNLHIGGLDGLVLAGLVVEGLVGVGKLLLNHTCKMIRVIS